MKHYLYCYQTFVSFSFPVTAHSVLLRCQPMLGGFQTVEEEHLIASPDFSLRRSTDAFGNRIVYGSQRLSHTTWAYVSTGIVTTGEYVVRGTADESRLYTIQTRFSSIPSEILTSFNLTGNVSEDALRICHYVHEMLTYAPLATTIETTAVEAMRLRQGVCQDFAHVMIGLCRELGMAARYVCGFLEGTGATHAWVEVFDGYAWLGYDPTHDRHIDYGYIKIAHGRDAADCSVSRGTYVGQAMQHTQINVTLKEI